MQLCKVLNTKRLKNDFSSSKVTEEDWYDLREDWDLIEASIAKQYGIRIRTLTDMPWTEFCNLLSGIMPDTPLGQIVSIRSEDDKENLKNFTPHQRKIRTEWRNKIAKEKILDQEAYDKQMEDMEKMLDRLFGKK